MSEGYSTPSDDQYRYPAIAPVPMLAFVPRTCRRLLDVGCAGGEFGALVKQERHAEVWGIDPSPEAVDRAMTNLDHFVNAPFSTDAGLPERYFDVICFNDALEHFADTTPVLKTARGLLAPGGCLVMSVPNVRYIDNVLHLVRDQDWRYEQRGIRDSTHLRFFTKKSIQRTLHEHGFEVREIAGIRPKYWVGRAARPFVRLFGDWLEDMNYLQYAIVATPRDEPQPRELSSARPF